MSFEVRMSVRRRKEKSARRERTSVKMNDQTLANTDDIVQRDLVDIEPARAIFQHPCG